MTRILRLDSSARTSGSVSRALTDKIIARFDANGTAKVVTRDLTQGLPLLTEAWVGANFTREADRTPEQKETLALSDALVAELKQADVVVIGVPIYNFGVPAALKAWIDLIARAGVTFRYTENGPVGLLEGKRAILAVASDSVEAGSPVDFASTHMRQVLNFVGITDISVVRAEKLNLNSDAATAQAAADLDAIKIAA